MSTETRYYLECTTPGHNKFYEIWVEPDSNSGYTVRFKYGKIGTTGLVGSKGSNMAFGSAVTMVMKLRSEKISKGYVDKTAAKNVTIKILPPANKHVQLIEPVVEKKKKPKKGDDEKPRGRNLIV